MNIGYKKGVGRNLLNDKLNKNNIKRTKNMGGKKRMDVAVDARC